VNYCAGQKHLLFEVTSTQINATNPCRVIEPRSIAMPEVQVRVSLLIGGLIVVASIGLCAGLEPAKAQGVWCARTSAGAGRIEEDCFFNSFEACRRTVISGNRGFCTQNPAFVGSRENPNRKKRRRQPQ
jgi:hypothetical protein